MKRIDILPVEIQIFLEVERARSFRVAAERCGLSQPAISRAVARIEDRLQARLFDRTNRQVELTPQGEAFRPIARRIVRDLTMSIDELRTSLTGEEGRVAVAVLPSVAFSLLPNAIGAFRRKYPSVTVAINDTLLGGVEKAVLEGEVDFGIAVAPARELPGQGLTFEPLTADRFVAVLKRDHELAARDEIRWADLADHPFVAMATTTSVRSLTDRAFRMIDVDVAPAYEVAHLATAGALIASEFGMGALPELTLPALRHPDLVTRPLVDPVMERTIGILRRSGKTLSSAAERFRRELLPPASPDDRLHVRSPSSGMAKDRA